MSGFAAVAFVYLGCGITLENGGSTPSTLYFGEEMNFSHAAVL